MKVLVTTVTQRGQVTIPAEVRRHLRIKPQDKVSFTIVDGRVELAPIKYTLEDVFGSLKPLKNDLKTAERDVWDEKVARELRKLR
jgi:AbrB family looped-hinge helix DNA binding protein